MRVLVLCCRLGVVYMLQAPCRLPLGALPLFVRCLSAVCRLFVRCLSAAPLPLGALPLFVRCLSAVCPFFVRCLSAAPLPLGGLPLFLRCLSDALMFTTHAPRYRIWLVLRGLAIVKECLTAPCTPPHPPLIISSCTT